jgi:competence protein ComFC
MRKPEPLNAEYFCVSCRTPFVNAFPLDSEGRCALCRSGLRAFDAAYSYGAYGEELRELIHLLKYSGMRPLAEPLGALLLRSLPRDESFDAIVPVPLHWFRRWKRGFNQSDLLARVVGRSTGIPVLHALRREHFTPPQAGLSNSARRRNMVRAFRCTREKDVRGKRVLLVDDVMTTGSTVSACARALKRAGAKRVAVLTVARADRRLPAPARPAPDFRVEDKIRNGQ